MLKENIKNLRKSKGLSQEELAVKLHVVRQTVSKWENGLSVPDAAELISLAEELDTPVGVLLGETVPEHEPDDMSALSEKLAAINLQLAERSAAKRKAIRWGAFPNAAKAQPRSSAVCICEGSGLRFFRLAAGRRAPCPLSILRPASAHTPSCFAT